LSNLGKEEKVA